MSQATLKFKLNDPHVIEDNIDSEVIAINLETGSYYSMENSGAFIWGLVIAGATLEEIRTKINECYTGDQALIEQAVQQFLVELQHAQLIVPQTDRVGAMPAGASKVGPFIPYEKNAFEPPLLNAYTDMQELLLIDPVHEVGRQGWPMRKP